MNKTILIGLLAVIMLQSGCATRMNHNRVADNMSKKAILASGNNAQIEAIKRGGDPSEVLKVRAYTNGDDTGVILALDVLDFDGWSGYFKTFAEAPISSTVSLAIDIGAAYAIGKAAYDEYQGNNTVEIVEDPAAAVDAEANDNDSPNSDITITAGSNPIIIINNGDGNSFDAGNTDDHGSDNDNSY